jgi:hypothetical protein
MGVLSGPADLATGTVNGLRYWRHAVRDRGRFEATLPDLVTTRQAASEVYVTEDRIRQWASRGILTRYGRVSGRAYYSLADVHRTAAIMRTGADTRAVLRRVLDDLPVTESTDPASD